MNHFHGLLSHVLEHGQYKPNRTGVGTFASVGHMLKSDLSERFEAAVTTKKLAFKSVVGELLGFFRGYTNAADFRALGCNVWDKNANETEAWLKNKNRKGHDDLGRIYGAQWTAWRDTRYAKNCASSEELASQGYELIAHDKERSVWVYERTINQLETALRALLQDPYNRRIVVNGWRPDEFDNQALSPCHVAYQFVYLPDGKLHSTLWIRSNDLFLGSPFNQASLGVFTAIMARLAGMQLGTTTVFISDAHIYENHVEQTQLQLSREHLKAPRLVLSDRIKKIENLDDIKGAFERIEPEDIWLEEYVSHPGIPAPMAA